MESIRKNKMPGKNHILIFVYIALAVMLIILITFVSTIIPELNENSTAVKINGEPVSVKEFKQKMSEMRADIFSYFKQKHGIDDNANFWTSSYGGEIPVELLREKALNGLKKIKIEQILAKQQGLIQDISYTAFLDALKKENERRKEAVKNRQVIYGPEQYGEKEYFSYVHSNMLIKLKEKLQETSEFKIPEEVLIKRYDADREKVYKNVDIIRVKEVSVSWAESTGKDDNSNKDEARGLINQIKAGTDMGEKLEDAVKAFANNPLKVKISERVFGEYSRREESEEVLQLQKQAESLAFGKLSGIIETGSAFYIIECIEKKNQGYKLFNEVKGAIKSTIIDLRFEQLVEKLVKEAKVEKNDSVYYKIMIR